MNSDWARKIKSLIDEGRVDKALSIINKVLDQNPSSKEALLLKAQIHEQQNNNKISLKLYKTLLSLYETREDLETQIDILTSIGHIQRRLGNLEEATEAFNEVLSKFDLLERPLADYLIEQKLFRLDDLASVEREKGDLEGSLETRRQILKLHRKVGSQVGIIEDLEDMASIYQSTGNEQKAEKYYRHALAEGLDTEDNYLEPLIRYELGNILFQSGKYEEAAEHLMQVVEHFRDLELLHPLFEENDFEEYENAKILLRQIVNKMIEKAGDWIQQGKINSAKAFCKKLSPIIKNYEYNKAKAEFYYYSSLISVRESDLSDAKAHLQRSIRILKQEEGYKDTHLYSKIKALLGDIKAENR